MLSENIIKGQIIELKVQEELLRYGFDVSIPSYNASKYDIIADTGRELLKIQVKKAIGTSAKNVDSFKISCTTQNVKSSTGSKHKYTVDEVDYFATVWKDKVYFIPIDETSMVKTIRADDETYLSETIFSMYKRLSDVELYNYTEENVSKNYCIDCGCEIAHTSERCVSCFNKLERVIERPTREELKKMLRTKTFLQIGKDYGVSDNAVRKWCDKERLPRKISEIKKFSEEEWKNI